MLFCSLSAQPPFAVMRYLQDGSKGRVLARPSNQSLLLVGWIKLYPQTQTEKVKIKRALEV